MRLNKVILSVISYIVVGGFQTAVWGQTISGKIIDSEQHPIEGATIVSVSYTHLTLPTKA